MLGAARPSGRDGSGGLKNASLHPREWSECHSSIIRRSRWSDRLFQMQTSTSCTYVLSRGATIVGYLTVHFSNENMFIDEVAIDDGQKRRGYGGDLMRFADTLARQGNCRTVFLNAIESKIGFYESLDYKQVAPSTPILLEDETCWPMQRSVLYHQRPK